MTDRSHLERRRKLLTATVTDFDVERQRAFLIGVVTSTSDIPEAETSIAELALLTDTAGSVPIFDVVVRRDSLDAGTLIGRPRAEALAQEATSLDVDVVVFDRELSPGQQRNLQEIFECDVVDRVGLILDIFAQHAHSSDGMLQVELAQHRYRLPRLRGQGQMLSRQGGGVGGSGIGTRGPGETKLETDRRRILDRIRKVEGLLVDLVGDRKTRSKSRRKAGLPLLSLVGYTNAGKSTLFNALTGADVLVEDRLFATLDSTVRKLALPNGHDALASDTVGFVRNLPHQLVKAFQATLEEVGDADVLLHIVDASDSDPDRQIDSVREVLREIGAGDIDELVVFNKIDIADGVAVDRLLALYPGSVAVSAVTGDGLDGLLEAALEALRAGTVELNLLVPYANGDVVARLHDAAEVLSLDHDQEGTLVTVLVPAADVGLYEAYVRS
ncbi:GTPase HflX [bacterium BMS3Bbin02]|nr:GTPase HflX [bacterium BMS3Bbin02]